MNEEEKNEKNIFKDEEIEIDINNNKNEIEKEDTINLNENNKKILENIEENDENIQNNEILRIESSPIENEFSYRTKIRKPNVNFIINNSNAFNQFTSTEIIKDDNKNIEEGKDDNINDIENINNNENIKNDDLDKENKEENINDNNNDNINLEANININNNDINNNLDNIEEINTNINNIKDNNIDINTNINNKDNKDEDENIIKEKNEELNNLENILNKNDEFIINTDINYIDKIEVLNEASANRVNVSKEVKLQGSPQLTLYELMDEPSYTKIYIDFPEIKEIKFTEDDFGGENNKNIRKLIINGIPKTFLNIDKKEKTKKISIYTPHKIKIGKNYLITKRINKDNNIINNINTYNNYDRNNDNLLLDINENNKLKTYNKFYKNNNKENNIIKTSRSHSKVLKIGSKINSISAQRTNSPLFRKKINIIKKKSNNIKLNNLGNIKDDN